MKKLLPFLVLAALGCQVKIDDTVDGKKVTPTPTPVKDSATPPAKDSKTADTAKPGTTKTDSSKTDTPPVVADESSKPGYNKNRIHQLFDLKTATITVNGQPLTAWIMDSDTLRQEGMMFVKDDTVKPDQAMLFIFPDSQPRGFWMHNTLMPLDIAYIDKDKKVVNAATMSPETDKTTPSTGPAQYVLEMKQGTNSRLGITKGSTVSFPDTLKATD
jgi:uncharacterized membrane protein (UPF0127 family)